MFNFNTPCLSDFYGKCGYGSSSGSHRETRKRPKLTYRKGFWSCGLSGTEEGKGRSPRAAMEDWEANNKPDRSERHSNSSDHTWTSSPSLNGGFTDSDPITMSLFTMSSF